MATEFKQMIKVISPGKIIKSIIIGENLLVIMKKLLQTFQKVDNLDQSADQNSNTIGLTNSNSNSKDTSKQA